jgi:hypothetical protein
LFGPVALGHHPLRAVERPLQKHELKASVGVPQRFDPLSAKARVHLAPPIDDGHRHAASPACLADVARFSEHGQECGGFLLRPVALGLFLELRLLRGDERHLLLPNHPFLQKKSGRASEETGPNRNSSLFLSCTESA